MTAANYPPRDRLETPKQPAERVGISPRQIRHLIQTGELEHVKIGSRVHIPMDAFPRFLESNRTRSWHAETKGAASGGSASACYYVVWTENGAAASARRARQTANRLKRSSGKWLQTRGRRSGPSDFPQVLITDLLAEYASERGPTVVAKDRIAYAVDALTDFWAGLTAADITPHTWGRYAQVRQRAAGSVRRELGVLRAAVKSPGQWP